MSETQSGDKNVPTDGSGNDSKPQFKTDWDELKEDVELRELPYVDDRRDTLAVAQALSEWSDGNVEGSSFSLGFSPIPQCDYHWYNKPGDLGLMVHPLSRQGDQTEYRICLHYFSDKDSCGCPDGFEEYYEESVEDFWIQPCQEIRVTTNQLEQLVLDLQLFYSSLNFEYDQRTKQRPDR